MIQPQKSMRNLASILSICGKCLFVLGFLVVCAFGTATEIPLAIKTRADAWPALARAIRERHPYELPEIVAVSLTDALPEYLDWIDAQTRPG